MGSSPSVTDTPRYGTQPPRAGLSGYASCRHAVGLLSETNALHGEISDRVAVQRIILDMVIDWHEANSATLTAARESSMAWATSSAGPDLLKIRHEYLGRDEAEDVNLSGYQLDEPLDPELVAMDGLTVDESYFAPMQQHGRIILDREVGATRVSRVNERSSPLPNRPLIGMHVHVEGKSRPVVGMRAKLGGIVRDVLMPTE